MMIKSHAKLSSAALLFNTITALIILRTINGKTRLINDVNARQRNAKIRLFVYGLAYLRIWRNSFIFTETEVFGL